MLRSIVSRLDWKSPGRAVTYGTHGRILLPITVCSAIGVGVVYALYPHAFWFLVFWCGAVMGQAAGFVIGVPWQLASGERVPRTSGRFIALGVLASAFFMVMAFPWALPLLRAQETERAAFRALAARDIIAVVARGRCVATTLSGPESIGDVRRRVAAAEVYIVSHESEHTKFTLSFALAGGKTVEYAAGIPERHPEDVAVTTGAAEMLVEGLRPLLQIEADSSSAGCR